MKNETAIRELRHEFPNVIIRASAGTGKTFALSNRYLRLLASGAECQSILASTFTKKGAGEILDRIIGRLADAALDAKGAERLSSDLGWKISQARAGDILRELLRSLHRLEISTLDSFFSRIAKVFSLELGLPPNWEIVEEQQNRRLYDVAIQQVLQTEPALELLSLMGKGEVARRISTMLQDTVDRIYHVYRESGNEPWNQIPQTQQFLSDQQLEAIVAEMEATQIPKPGFAKVWPAIIEHVKTGNWECLIKCTAFQNFLDGNLTYQRAPLCPEVVHCFQRLLPNCQAYVENLLIKQNQSTQQLLEKFDFYLHQIQSEVGSLRFDDVTIRLQNFVRRWTPERYAFRLDQQIQHVLLDEFQDTSLAQWQILYPFAKWVTDKRESLRSFFCVGDMKQAIFGWRGGIAQIFDLVSDELGPLGAETRTQSWRSAPPVIDFVNQVFLQAGQYRSGDPVVDSAIGEWTQWFQPHSTARQQYAGYVTIEKADGDALPSGDENSRERKANEQIELKTIERIRNLVEQLPPDKTIGVIVRTNAEVSRLIAELQSVGIHASEEAGGSLVDSAAIDLVLSAMTLADHPGDSLARFHLSHSPLAEVLGLFPETVANQAENIQRGIRAGATIRQRLLHEGYGAVVESWARQLSAHCTQRELTRLQQLIQVAYSYGKQPDLWELRPKRFADFVRDDVRVTDPSGSQVRVMTIHKAKGLEFDVVVYPIPHRASSWSGNSPTVVVGRETPTSPIRFVTRYIGKEMRKLLSSEVQALFDEDQRRDVREAMCVLYVALTRAAHATHVIVASNAKPDHKSSAGLLMATACAESYDQKGVIYETGDATWYRKKKPQDSVKLTESTEFRNYYLPTDIKLKPKPLSATVRSGRGGGSKSLDSPPEYESPVDNGLSALVVGENSLERQMLRRCFDLVKWLDQHSPNAQQLEAHLRGLFPFANPQPIIKQFFETIERTELRKLLSLKSYQLMHLAQFTPADSLGLESNRLEVQPYRRIATRSEQGSREIELDRLVLVYEGERLIGADLIVYHGESPSAESDQLAIDNFKTQFEELRAAVAQLIQLPASRISTRLVFIKSGQVVNYSIVEVTAEENSPSSSSVLFVKSAVSENASPRKSVPASPPSKPKTKSSQKSARQQQFWED